MFNRLKISMEFRNCNSNADKVKLYESVRKSLAEIYQDEPETLALLRRTCFFLSKKSYWLQISFLDGIKISLKSQPRYSCKLYPY